MRKLLHNFPHAAVSKKNKKAGISFGIIIEILVYDY